VVLLVFDQLRGDYLEKWRGQFGEGGFKRLQDDGAWFTNCHYPYAITTTGPGHASMMTGAPPSRTGIINNDWYDRAAADTAYCAGTTKYTIVPATPVVKPTDPTKGSDTTVKPKQVGTPDRLLSPTVGDVLKDATGGKGKVIGMSLKDRSAIFPSGHKPDGAYWFDKKFVTSTYYRDAVPAWVAEFNKSGKAETYFGKPWVRYQTTADYAKLVGPDKSAGEGKGTGQGVEFPHPLDGGEKALGSKYYSALANSPYGNELLLEFAKAAIEAENLGTDETPDLLTVSFSSNDLIGHTWGPDSQEVLDVTLRSDAIVANLLTHLDAKVGQGNYAVILTADHGICPIPEVAARQGIDAKRVSALKFALGAETFLKEKYADAEAAPKEEKAADTKEGEEAPLPKTRWMEKISPPYVYLNHRLIKAKGLKVEDVANDLAAWVRTFEGVQAAYTHADLTAGKVDTYDEIGQKVLLAFHPERSGDLFVVLKPYHLIGSVAIGDRLVTGTTHGSPHAYDTHTPLLVYGPGVSGGKRDERVAPLHAAPVAADFLGVAPPKDALYGVPKTLKK
jgi:arylsulfatase A-like enzyme